MSDTFRVAHVTPAYFSKESIIGGGERYVYYIARALSMAGPFQQCVFGFGSEDKLFEHQGIPVRILRNQSRLADSMSAHSAELWRELRGFGLVHVHQSLTICGAYTIAIARSLGIPVVGTDLGGGEYSIMLRGRGLELLDGVVSISRYAHSLIAPFFSGLHEILTGPVNTDHFSPAPSTHRDRRTVLCVSRILPHKGIDRVIAALPSELELMVVGQVYHSDYYSLLLQMARNKNVRFIHDADDEALVRLYRSAGLFVQASTFKDVYGNTVIKPELMGLTTLEAMASGLPAVVSDAGSLPELVPDDRFGRVFYSEQELSNILKDFAAGVWPLPGAGELACRHVTSTHSMKTIGTRLANFYKMAATREGRAA